MALDIKPGDLVWIWFITQGSHYRYQARPALVLKVHDKNMNLVVNKGIAKVELLCGDFTTTRFMRDLYETKEECEEGSVPMGEYT